MARLDLALPECLDYSMLALERSGFAETPQRYLEYCSPRSVDVLVRELTIHARGVEGKEMPVAVGRRMPRQVGTNSIKILSRVARSPRCHLLHEPGPPLPQAP